jgi:pSer/pThr/pTyr-binding forkhead associated (FHA) protein
MGVIEVDGRVVPLREGVFRIGRSMTADLRFEDASVGNRHALVVSDGDSVRVLDDRGPGVRVNGRRVSAQPLRDGDLIEVGRHVLRFLAADAAELTPQAMA